jgi:hypothetical protein
MPILIGLGFALVLLYLWLLGHWFARGVMLLALAVLLGGVELMILSPTSRLASAFARTIRWFQSPGRKRPLDRHHYCNNSVINIL